MPSTVDILLSCLKLSSTHQPINPSTGNAALIVKSGKGEALKSNERKNATKKSSGKKN